ncbi:hypothetical protein D3C84_793470 [compost metagenome]
MPLAIVGAEEGADVADSGFYIPRQQQMDIAAFDVALHALQQGRIAVAAGEVMELPGRAFSGEVLRHAPEWGDADSPGDQHGAMRALDQRKVVLRRTDLQGVAAAQGFVDEP